MPKLEKLTPEQEALIPVYCEKWRKIALSTEPIDPEKAAEAVKNIYAMIGLREPDQIIFCDSPQAAIWDVLRWRITNKARKKLKYQLDDPLKNQLIPKFLPDLLEKSQNRSNKNVIEYSENELYLELFSRIRLSREIVQNLSVPLLNHLRVWLERQSPTQQSEIDKLKDVQLRNCVREEFISHVCLFDFLSSVLNFSRFEKEQEVLQALVKECGWIFPYKRLCIICDRPRILRFDSENRVHAEGEPAIQFADGYNLYSYHGVTLPEKYGNIHPHQWQPAWILKEGNAELRRVLIQGIGYARICQELRAVELNSWQEYTLLKLDANADIEPIVLLKMTCPSTGHIHALRVPPAMTSARDAIRWVNHGVDPADFEVQT